MSKIRARSLGPARPDAPIIEDIGHLGARGTTYLLALVRAKRLGRRVAPTREATASVISLLDALGVVRGERHPTPTCHVTFGDGLPWSYTWSNVAFHGLERALADRLSRTCGSALYESTWLGIWQELVLAEVIAFVRHQLRIHQFNEAYLDELTPLLALDDSRYSLVQWRHACWGAVRSMASVSALHPGNVELLRFTLSNELQHRLQTVAAPHGNRCMAPKEQILTCTLSRVLCRVATHLGSSFWKSPPTLPALTLSNGRH